MDVVPANARTPAGRTVLIVAEDEVTRMGLRLLLRNLQAVGEVIESHHPAECLRVAREVSVAVVVADVSCAARRGGLRVLADLARLPSSLPVVVCTDDVLGVSEHCRASRLSYICLPRGLHSASMLSQALEQILAGPTRTPVGEIAEKPHAWLPTIDPIISLTSKEREVLSLVAAGGSSKEIAAALRVSLRTIESHRARICAKLGVRTVAGLTKVAIRVGLAFVGEGLPGSEVAHRRDHAV